MPGTTPATPGKKLLILSEQGSSTEPEDVSLCNASVNNSRLNDNKPARLLTETFEQAAV